MDLHFRLWDQTTTCTVEVCWWGAAYEIQAWVLCGKTNRGYFVAMCGHFATAPPGRQCPATKDSCTPITVITGGPVCLWFPTDPQFSQLRQWKIRKPDDRWQVLLYCKTHLRFVVLVGSRYSLNEVLWGFCCAAWRCHLVRCDQATSPNILSI